MPVKQEPVNIKLQIIFAFIPFLNLYAFYKIQKLRLALLIFLPLGFLSRLLEATIVRVNDTSGMLFVLSILFAGLSIGVLVWLMHKWSKQWNEKFSDKELDQT